MKSRLRTRSGRIASALGLTVVATGVLVSCAPVAQVVTEIGEDFLATGRTMSFFTAVQIDPRSEDSAGPQFVVAEDLDGDGLMDLVSAWSQNQPVQVHLQRRSALGAMRFESLILAGNIPVISVAGLAVADFDNDGHQDIAVLAKDTGLSGATCLDSKAPQGETAGLNGLIIIYFGSDDPANVNQSLAWSEVQVGASSQDG